MLDRARTLVRSNVQTPPDSWPTFAGVACCGLKSALRPPSLTRYSELDISLGISEGPVQGLSGMTSTWHVLWPRLLLSRGVMARRLSALRNGSSSILFLVSLLE